MEYETILATKEYQVGVITLNRPWVLNAFNTTMARELNDCLRQLDNDDEVMVIIIKGAGRAFSAGIDINEFPGKSPLEYRHWIEIHDEMHLTIASMKKPVIAQAHGYAMAYGAGLLVAADFAIVAKGTRIGCTGINVGLLCTGVAIHLSYSLSKQKTLELLLGGDMIDVCELERLGLVNKIVPADKLHEETMAFAQKLASKSYLAVQMGKQFYYQMINMPFQQRIAYGREVLAKLCATKDAQEGVYAFLTKRQAVWSGK